MWVHYDTNIPALSLQDKENYRTFLEGAVLPTLRGRRWGPESHLGGGGQGEGPYIQDIKPQPYAEAGAYILLSDIWEEDVLQCLPPATFVCQERIAVEHLPRLIL